MNRDSTAAKIGRSIKKREIMPPPQVLSENPSPRPPPRGGEGEQKNLREPAAQAKGCLPPPLRSGEGAGGRGCSTLSHCLFPRCSPWEGCAALPSGDGPSV